MITLTYNTILITICSCISCNLQHNTYYYLQLYKLPFFMKGEFEYDNGSNQEDRADQRH